MLISLFFAYLSHLIVGRVGIIGKKWQYFYAICDKSATKMKLPTPRKRGETYTITVSYEKKDTTAQETLRKNVSNGQH